MSSSAGLVRGLGGLHSHVFFGIVVFISRPRAWSSSAVCVLLGFNSRDFIGKSCPVSSSAIPLSVLIGRPRAWSSSAACIHDLRWLHSHVLTSEILFNGFIGRPRAWSSRASFACLHWGLHRHASFTISLVFVGFIRLSSLGPNPVQCLPRQASCVIFIDNRLWFS